MDRRTERQTKRERESERERDRDRDRDKDRDRDRDNRDRDKDRERERVAPKGTSGTTSLHPKGISNAFAKAWGKASQSTCEALRCLSVAARE